MHVSRTLVTIARALLGLIFFVFGLNGFFNFFPPPPIEGGAAAFIGALGATGYMLPLVKGTEVVAGGLLLSGRYVPLGLVLLAPILVNIILFHTVLTPVNPMVFVLLGLELFLAWSYREYFRGVLTAKASPTG
ncbi:MAG: DoxX family membrane protein [Nannocystaceae bacterium]